MWRREQASGKALFCVGEFSTSEKTGGKGVGRGGGAGGGGGGAGAAGGGRVGGPKAGGQIHGGGETSPPDLGAGFTQRGGEERESDRFGGGELGGIGFSG